MGLFGGCGNNSWIWVLIIIVLIFGCCDNDSGLFGGRNNDGCCEDSCC